MQGFRGKLYTNAKPALRVSPYFQSFSSNQTFRRMIHPTLIIQKLQAIKYIKQHNISYQQAHSVHLSHLRDDCTNKRYSYLRVTTIRIDVHPIGENPINTPHAFHAQFTYGPRRQPFTSPHKDETGPYTREKSWLPKTNWPDRRLGSPHSPSLTTALELGREVLAK
jgi:hypothetical protein